MERAGRVLGKLKLAKQGVSDEELARSAWPVAVGKKIASSDACVRPGAHPPSGGSGRRGLAAPTLDAARTDSAADGADTGTEDRRRTGVQDRRTTHEACTRAEVLDRLDRRGRRDSRPGIPIHLQSCAEKSKLLKITEQEVRYVADLANLRLTDEEVQRMATRSRRDSHAHRQAERAGHHRASSRWRRCSYDAEETATLRDDVERPPLGTETALAECSRVGRRLFQSAAGDRTMNDEHSVAHDRPDSAEGLREGVSARPSWRRKRCGSPRRRTRRPTRSCTSAPSALWQAANASTSRLRTARDSGRWPACRSRSRMSSSPRVCAPPAARSCWRTTSRRTMRRR